MTRLSVAAAAGALVALVPVVAVGLGGDNLRPAGGTAGRAIEVHNHFPTTASPESAYDAAGGRIVAALSATGL